MSNKLTLSLVWWLQALLILFVIFGFISATEVGLLCCTTCLIFYFITGAWKKQLEQKIVIETELKKALIYERQMDYDHALAIYRRFNMTDEIRRINEMKYGNNNVKVASPGVTNTTIIHGNYVNDNDTIVKDSVLNRSNIGGGNSKADELQKVLDLKEKGLISNEEYEKMKQEIIG